MRTAMEEFLSRGSTASFLLGLFALSQTWILLTLGDTGPDVLQLQTMCLLHPTPSWTGDAARKLLGNWTTTDIFHFQRHYLLDYWFHPVLYALFFTSALLYTLNNKENNNPKKHNDDMSTILYGRIGALLICLGAACDILENQRHAAIQFSPTLIASNELLWQACLFASTKWVIMNGIASWLFCQFFCCSNTTTTTSKSALNYGKDWIGPQPQDHLNTPCEAAGLLKVQGRDIPWTLSASGSYDDPDRSYVVSPYGHYIGYGFDEVLSHTINAPISRFVALTICRCVGFFFRLFQFDDTIFFNNLLLSTNLWPNTIDWTKEGQVDEIQHALLEKCDHKRACVWRSVDAFSQPTLCKVLSETPSCMMLPSRIVNWCHYSNDEVEKEALFNKKNFKRDIKLFRKKVGWDVVQQQPIENAKTTPQYEMVHIEPDQLTREDAAQMADLFHQLYVVKYSRRNPQLTTEGLMRMVQTGFLKVDVLRERSASKKIIGFSTPSTIDGVRTPSYVGYDIRNDHAGDMYRLVMMMIYCNLMRDGLDKCHLSGGANEFKRHRGAQSTVEYSAVFVGHLPWYRQLPWKVAKFIADRVITIQNAY